jgi:transcriptional regulator with XRE-family HTH domain
MSTRNVISQLRAGKVIKLATRKGRIMTVGQRLKSARETAGYTQQELAEECGWGDASQSRVANYESDTREPTLADIDRMAKVLGVPPEEIAFATSGLTLDEQLLIQSWRVAGPDGKEAIRAVAKMAKRPRRYKKPNIKEVPKLPREEKEPNHEA